MNKKLFTLVALLGLFVTFGANAADLVKGNYYYLKVAAASGNGYLSIHQKADSLIALSTFNPDAAANLAAAGDSALWAVSYEKNDVTGNYIYTIVNKVVKTQQLSFTGNTYTTEATVAGSKVSKKAKMAGSLKFTGTTVALGTETVFYSYLASQDSTLQLYNVDAFTSSKVPVSFAKIGGNAPTAAKGRTSLQVTFEKPGVRTLTATQLNSILNGNGFQLFASYNGKEVSENNPLLGIRFYAEGKGGDQNSTQVALKAASVNPNKNNNFAYAYIDSVSYSAAGNLPDDGSRMLLNVDTIPAKMLANGGDTTRFTFTIDPSVVKDSVFVTVANAIKFTAKNDPKTWVYANPKDTSAVQVDPLNLAKDQFVLTTGAGSHNGIHPVNTLTILSFTGKYTPVLDLDKVYSVKYKNNAGTNKAHKDEYAIVDLANTPAYGKAAYDHIPATQFVYNGTQLVNRENELFAFGPVYKVEGDIYTNVTDTFEVKAMTEVDIENERLGYRYFTDADLVNNAYTFEYLSGILTGRSLNVSMTATDSLVVAENVDGMLFRLEAVGDEDFGPQGPDYGVVGLNREAYYLKSKDGKYYVNLNNKTNQLNITTLKSNAKAFFFREIEAVDNYITLPAQISGPTADMEYTYKYNVNSTTAILEQVSISLDNNAFQIKSENDAPYVLDAMGHYVFTNGRTEAMTKGAQDFAAFRLLSEVTGEDDFKLYVDTASTKDKTRTLYYILKGAVDTPNSNELEGNFLRSMADSIANKDYVQIVEGVTLPRLKFIEAYRYATGADSLLLNPSAEKNVATDSIGFSKGSPKANKADINQFRFAIQKSKVDGFFKIENNAKFTIGTGPAAVNYDKTYVAIQNNVLYLATDANSALLVTMDPVSAPTGNDDAQVEAGVKVYVADGAIIVAGAEGKVVAINNILGQMVAKRTAASNYESFAAPAGTLIVVVDGESFKVSL